jgi:hypothetical protein
MTAAVSALSSPVRIGPEGLPKHTIGWHALSWSAEFLRQPDGPDAGAPWRFNLSLIQIYEPTRRS